MEAPPAESGAAGWAQPKPKVSLPPPTAAASLPVAAAPAAPRRLFKGVFQQGNSFVAVAHFSDGKKQRKGSFYTAEAAAHAYDDMMREHKRLVVNFPQLPGEIQAEPGVVHQATLVQHERDPNRVAHPVRRATAPPRVEDMRQYKGVQPCGSRFMVQGGKSLGGTKGYLGCFASAREAADVYDAHVRLKTPPGVAPVVNTPLHAGELQAVPGWKDTTTRRRAMDAARGAVLRVSCRGAALAVPADALTPMKRTASEAASEDDDDAGTYAVTEPAAPEPKRLLVPEVSPAPLPPAPVVAAAVVAAPPLPLPLARLEAAWMPPKGVYQRGPHRFEAQYCCTQTEHAKGARSVRTKAYLGIFETEKDAADAYDAYVRRLGSGSPPVVNTPLHPGEVQAVPGERDAVTRQRAFAHKARDEPSEDAAAGGYAAYAPAAPTLKHFLVPAAPRAPQQSPALAAAAPAAADFGISDAVSFLRRISPPLTDIDRVVACAAASGMQMGHLRGAVRAPAHEGASRLHQLYDVLGICRAADKMALTVALLPMAA